jgi:hypothetical protein
MRVPGGDARVVEVELGAVGHVELFHDAARGSVADGGDGDDFGEMEGVEGVVDDGARAFGGEALAVGFAAEAPADFDGGLREIGDDGVHGLHADDAEEFAGRGFFGGEHGEAVTVELHVVAGHGFVGFGERHGGGEVGHDDGVGVDGGEGDAVAILPGAEEEAGGGELKMSGHAYRGSSKVMSSTRNSSLPLFRCSR